MSLETPNKIRELQRKLYRKAKEAPDYRFYLLYDKIHREDIFRHAYALAKANAGAPGVDQESFSGIETKGWENWLEELRKELQAKTYKPQPVRRVMIPKPGGGERPLGIPTIRDRMVQTALKLVVEPIFEADMEPSAYQPVAKVPIFRNPASSCQQQRPMLCKVLFRTKQFPQAKVRPSPRKTCHQSVDPPADITDNKALPPLEPPGRSHLKQAPQHQTQIERTGVNQNPLPDVVPPS
jgi:hypothetical protein